MDNPAKELFEKHASKDVEGDKYMSRLDFAIALSELFDVLCVKAHEEYREIAANAPDLDTTKW